MTVTNSSGYTTCCWEKKHAEAVLAATPTKSKTRRGIGTMTINEFALAAVAMIAVLIIAVPKARGQHHFPAASHFRKAAPQTVPRPQKTAIP
jgi:hypothetical protein